MTRTILRLALASAATIALASGAIAADKKKSDGPELPHCVRPIGVMAVVEPEKDWWSAQSLGSPEALLKVMVQESGCFDLVDRGKGMAAMQAERALAASGDLRVGSNIGQGQMVAADYVMVPDIVTSNGNAGGTSLGGFGGGLLGGGLVGALAGGLSFSDKEADVTLAISDVRSSRILATIKGHSEKTDVGFSLGGAMGGFSGIGGAGASSYNNTAIGKVIVMAYIDAYSKLVDQLGGVVADGGSANSAAQAVQLIKPTNMYKEASSRSAVVRPLDVGMKLYPTGQKDGLMWEVQDELQNKGWVSSINFELAKN